MILDLREQVRVGAVFEGSWPKPVWFGFHGTKVVIKSVCYRWKERKGGDVIYKFTVTDGENLYEIAFSSRDMLWTLLAIDEGGYKEVN